VPVPANPEALILARQAGIDPTPCVTWAKDVLARSQPDGVWLQRVQAEKALKVLEAVLAVTEEDRPPVDLNQQSAAPVADPLLTQILDRLQQVLDRLPAATPAASADAAASGDNPTPSAPEPADAIVVVTDSATPSTPIIPGLSASDLSRLDQQIRQQVRAAVPALLTALTGRLPD